MFGLELYTEMMQLAEKQRKAFVQALEQSTEYAQTELKKVAKFFEVK